jgi:hypothetical protein
MAGKPDPLIIYIPGLLPKPEPESHRRELFRCLHEGIRRIDPEVAAELRERSRCFDIVSWTYDFYGEDYDISLDLAGIEALLQQDGPTTQDIAEAVSWKRRLVRVLYKAGDILPFLIPKLADKSLEIHLRDLRRYTKNDNDIAESTRRLLKIPLEMAAAANRPILLLAHSMGSVIAYDALWQLSYGQSRPLTIDTLITLGSPLGQRYIQERLLSHQEQGARRFPDNIRHWVNISACGELTALDTQLKNDFGAMETLGLLREIEDLDTFNYFRQDGELNVHAEYGYLINKVTARQVRDWWCKQR